MMHYILQTIAFQLLFLVVYDLFLKKETFFNSNRSYLLFTPILSLVLPMLRLDFIQNSIPQQYIVQLPAVLIGNASQAQTTNVQNLDAVTINATSAIGFFEILQLVYIAGIVVSFFYFGIKLYRIYKLKQSGKPENYKSFTLINLPESEAAFSFFNTVFLGENLSEKQRHVILAHEEVHIKERHTLDLIFFEILKMVFWFNPLIYVFQKRITALQEYMADAKAAAQNGKSAYYQSMLSQVFKTENITFINTFFNHSLIKKRIIMLQKSRSPKISKLKYLLLVPVIGAMLFYTSCTQETEVNEKSSLSEKIVDLQNELESRNELSSEEKLLLVELNRKVVNNNLTENLEIIEVVENTPPPPPPPLSSDKNNQEIIEIYETKSSSTAPLNDVPFAIIEKVPTFPGCENLSNAEAKKCMSQNIQDFVIKNFKTEIGNQNGLEGRQRIAVQFKIDKSGNVVDLRARAANPKLEEEAIRVVSSLPKMIPGEQRGEKVNVLYALPIIFDVK